MVERVRRKRGRPLGHDPSAEFPLLRNLLAVDEAQQHLRRRVDQLYGDLGRVPSMLALWEDFMAAGGVTGEDLRIYLRGGFVRKVKKVYDLRLIVNNPVSPAEPPPAKPAQRRRVA
jgi:hypothetical protein